MTTWNYRVCKRTHHAGKECEEIEYYIASTYYNEKGEICAVSDTPCGASSEDFTDLVKELEKMSIATSKDVVDLDTIIFASLGE